jgi:hypothetical protein
MFFLALIASNCATLAAAESIYGVDVSFPIHHNFLTPSSSLDSTKSIFGSDRIQTYSEFFSGCLKAYGKHDKAHLCHHHEDERLRLNRMQPRQMKNYTDIGFKKARVSEQVWKMIREFWIGQENRLEGNIPWGLHNESWPEGNTYTNHW